MKVNGRQLKGSFEPILYDGLRKLSNAEHNFKVEYETEVLDYSLQKTYRPDFIITFPDGRKIYIEGKGILDWEERQKLLAVRSQNPEADVRLVFMKDNRLRKGSEKRYSDWAKEHSFKYSIGSLPLEWFE